MEVRISGRHGASDEEIKQYVEQKLESMERYNHDAHSLEVVLDEDHLSRSVEVIAHMKRGAPVVVSAKHADARAAVDLAHDKLEKVLRRLKERQLDRRHQGIKPGAVAAPVPEEDEDVTQDVTEE